MGPERVKQRKNVPSPWNMAIITSVDDLSFFQTVDATYGDSLSWEWVLFSQESILSSEICFVWLCRGIYAVQKCTGFLFWIAGRNRNFELQLRTVGGCHDRIMTVGLFAKLFLQWPCPEFQLEYTGNILELSSKYAVKELQHVTIYEHICKLLPPSEIAIYYNSVKCIAMLSTSLRRFQYILYILFSWG